MLKRSNRQAAPSPALMHYEIAGVPLSLYADGSMQIGNHQFDQQTAFAIAHGLSFPGVKTTINRIERVRQAAEALEDDAQ